MVVDVNQPRTKSPFPAEAPDNLLFGNTPDSSTDEDDRPLIEFKRSMETHTKETLKSTTEEEMPFDASDDSIADPTFDTNVDNNESDDQIVVNAVSKSVCEKGAGELEPTPKIQKKRKAAKKPTKVEARQRELEPVPKKQKRRKGAKKPTKEEARELK